MAFAVADRPSSRGCPLLKSTSSGLRRAIEGEPPSVVTSPASRFHPRLDPSWGASDSHCERSSGSLEKTLTEMCLAPSSRAEFALHRHPGLFLPASGPLDAIAGWAPRRRRAKPGHYSRRSPRAGLILSSSGIEKGVFARRRLAATLHL